MNPQTKKKLEDALKIIRQYLNKDDGDIEIVEFDERAGLLKIKLLGNCKICDMNDFTFQFGIKRTFLSKVPEIKEIIIIEDDG